MRWLVWPEGEPKTSYILSAAPPFYGSLFLPPKKQKQKLTSTPRNFKLITQNFELFSSSYFLKILRKFLKLWVNKSKLWVTDSKIVSILLVAETSLHTFHMLFLRLICCLQLWGKRSPDTMIYQKRQNPHECKHMHKFTGHSLSHTYTLHALKKQRYGPHNSQTAC